MSDNRKIAAREVKKIFQMIWLYVKTLFFCRCPKCNKKQVRYIGDDYTGRVWIAVYECKNCKELFV